MHGDKEYAEENTQHDKTPTQGLPDGYYVLAHFTWPNIAYATGGCQANPRARHDYVSVGGVEGGFGSLRIRLARSRAVDNSRRADSNCSFSARRASVASGAMYTGGKSRITRARTNAASMCGQR